MSRDRNASGLMLCVCECVSDAQLRFQSSPAMLAFTLRVPFDLLIFDLSHYAQYGRPLKLVHYLQ